MRTNDTPCPSEHAFSLRALATKDLGGLLVNLARLDEPVFKLLPEPFFPVVLEAPSVRQRKDTADAHSNERARQASDQGVTRENRIRDRAEGGLDADFFHIQTRYGLLVELVLQLRNIPLQKLVVNLLAFVRATLDRHGATCRRELHGARVAGSLASWVVADGGRRVRPDLVNNVCYDNLQLRFLVCVIEVESPTFEREGGCHLHAIEHRGVGSVS
mmetsp:Transcript_119169/g.337101  ORF Transcript_119169/g.337101 Transcript_119169/m.337101 type:complete len:216 (-) Transcript_119169:804-1451(-)